VRFSQLSPLAMLVLPYYTTKLQKIRVFGKLLRRSGRGKYEKSSGGGEEGSGMPPPHR
jgi:hypothetical protein